MHWQRTTETLLKENHRLTLLAQGLRSVVATAPLLDQIQSLASLVCSIFSADACVFRALEGNHLVLLASCGIPDHQIYPSLPADIGLAGEIARRREPIAICDVDADSLTSSFRQRHIGFRFRSYAGAPLLLGEKFTGILGIYSVSEPRSFTPTELEQLAIVASHAAVALENHRLVQSLKKEKAERDLMLADALNRAERDPLTGLLNHNAFYRRLHEQAQVARTEGGSFALVMADMSNFKFFNESYGHTVGDRVLQLAGQHLQEFARPGDAVARLGGDEFALLLTDRSPEDLPTLTEQIQQNLLRSGYQPFGYAVEIPLQMSYGLAFFPQEATSIPELVQLADFRLLRNKRGGGGALSEALRARLARLFSGFSLLDSLVEATDARDRYSRRHSENVLEYAQWLARVERLSERETEILQAAALVKDAGKVGVPDRLLRLPAALSEAEFEQLKRHAELGALLALAAGLDPLVPVIRHHHESWDGTGYPDGLKGEAIPLLARILAIADSFAALTTDRPYRRSLPISAAFAELRAGSGRQWDPRLVHDFLAVAAEQFALTAS